MTQEILAKLRNLPPFQPVAVRVLQLSASGDQDRVLDEMVSIIETEPAFAAEILRVANSPLFGLKSVVQSIRHAVIVLGVERIKVLAIRTALRGYLGRSLQFLAVHRCWIHSIACAEIAREMAASFSHEPREYAYTAGLLHDIGRLGLVELYRSDYLPLFELGHETAGDVIEAEARLFGFDHCQAGNGLCILWNFPQALSEIALRHHEPISGRENSLLNMVRLACRMADSLGFEAIRYERGSSYDELRSALPAELRERFEFSGEELKAILERLCNVDQ